MSPQPMPARSSARFGRLAPARSRTRRGRPRTCRARRSAPSGSRPASAAASALPISSAPAPSLSGDALPAVTVPSFPNAGLSLASFSTRGVGADALVAIVRAVADRHRHDPVVVEAVVPRLRRPLVAAHRELVLRLARDAVHARHLLGALPERDRPLLGHLRVDHAPAERRRVQRLVPARIRPLGLEQHPRRAAHRLDAADQHQRRVAGLDRPARLHRGVEARAAQAVDGVGRARSSAGRPAAPPSARRCGCPRRRRWRRRTPTSSIRAGSRSGARASSRARRARPRSSGRTPASAPPARPNGVRTASRISASRLMSPHRWPAAPAAPAAPRRSAPG